MCGYREFFLSNLLQLQNHVWYNLCRIFTFFPNGFITKNSFLGDIMKIRSKIWSKLLPFLLTLLMVSAVNAGEIVDIIPEEVLLEGDVNHDRRLNIQDAVALYNHCIDPSYILDYEASFDFDGNKVVNTEDARYLFKHIVLPELYPLADTDEGFYQVFDIGMTWTEAKAYCESRGGHLVTITSQEENDYVSSLIKNGEKTYYWIGYTEENYEGTWEWINPEWESLNYTNWAEGQPSNSHDGTENYAGILRVDTDYGSAEKWNDYTNEGKWGDSFTYRELSGFVCEWDNTVRVRFVDSETREKLLLTDIFAPTEEDIANGYEYNCSGIMLSDRSADTYYQEYVWVQGIDVWPEGFVYIENDEIVFRNVPKGTDYWIDIDYSDANTIFKGYVFPNDYYGNSYTDCYGPLSITGNTTIVIPLEKASLIVGDVTVTPENCNDIFGDGTAVFDYYTETLTLTNVDITAKFPILAYMNNLNIVINGNVNLSTNDKTVVSVINNLAGRMHIYSEDSNQGHLNLTGSGENDFCIKAKKFVYIYNIDLTVGHTWGGIGSIYSDIWLSDVILSEETPNSVKAYLLNANDGIQITGSNIADTSNNGSMLFAKNGIYISYSTVSLSGAYPNMIYADEGHIYIETSNTIHLISTATEVNFDLIQANDSIEVDDSWWPNKIELPVDGVVYPFTDEFGDTRYAIRHADGSYASEILITPVE